MMDAISKFANSQSKAIMKMRGQLFISTKDYAEKVGVSHRYIQKLCKEGRIEGAYKVGLYWAVPSGFNYLMTRRKIGKPLTKRYYMRYTGNHKETAAIIAYGVVRNGISRRWSGPYRHFSAVQKILRKFNIILTNERIGEWKGTEDGAY